jgi:hypothetical protein
MEGFPENFNYATLIERPPQYDSSKHCIKEERSRLFCYMRTTVPNGNQIYEMDLSPQIPLEDRRKFLNELAQKFPDHFDLEVTGEDNQESRRFKPFEEAKDFIDDAKWYRIRIQ